MIYRICAGEHGLSQKEKLDVLPTPEEVRGRSPGYRRAARSIGFHSQAAGFFADFHGVARPLFIFNLSGEVEYELGDGSTLKISPGDGILFEDTTDPGHTTRVIGNSPRHAATVALD